jgi:anti-sigma factor RsiW
MMCPDREVQLNEYADGTLPAAERAIVTAHLGQCAGCRAALAELRGLVVAAGQLPRSLAPSRELWVGIARRIGPRAPGAGAWWRAPMFWRGALAAAATLVIGFGIHRLTMPRSVVPGGRSWQALEANYGDAAAELGRTLAAERDRLRPETIALVERNLALIDAALQESRAALAHDPANAALQQFVAAAYGQKVELLRWATRVATTSGT